METVGEGVGLRKGGGGYGSAVLVKSVCLCLSLDSRDQRIVGEISRGVVGGRAKRFTIALTIFYRRSSMFLKAIIMIRFPGCAICYIQVNSTSSGRFLP